MKIALLGYARSGKDTVFEMIKKRVRPVKRLSFGDGLRETVHEKLFPDLPLEPKPRAIYEKIGQALREIDPNYWVNITDSEFKFFQRIDLIMKKPFSYVITDLRQPNEAEWCRANGFKIVFVHSPDAMRQERSGNDDQFHAVNPSETEIWMIDADYTIFNNGTVEELEHEVDLLLHMILEDAQ